MKCSFIKQDGAQCKANAMSGLDYCYTHNPDISDKEKREAKQRGGQARALRIEKALPVLEINEPNDLMDLLIDTIRRVRSGELDIKTANCLGFLSDKLIKVMLLNGVKAIREQEIKISWQNNKEQLFSHEDKAKTKAILDRILK